MAPADTGRSGLRLSSFRLYLIYGFFFRASKSENERIERYLEHGPRWLRPGWVPPYDLNWGHRRISQSELRAWSGPVSLFYQPPRSTPDSETAPSPTQLDEVDLSTWLTLDPTGAGSLTFEFRAPSRNHGKLYDAKTILQWMHLVPRTIRTQARCWIAPPLSSSPDHDRLHRTTLLTLLEAPGTESRSLVFPPSTDDRFKSALLPSWKNFSVLFQLFVHCCRSILGSAWSEFPDFYGDQAFCTDPQIPYYYISGRVPGEIFERQFLHRDRDQAKRLVADKDRARLNQDVGAILGRWAEGENIDKVNLSYYKSRGFISEDGSFISQHRDSQIFVTHSPIAAISLHSDQERPPCPSSLTSQSLLRFFEFSRFRWHSLLWASRALDDIAEEAMRAKVPEELSALLGRLASIRLQVAHVVGDPIHHIWATAVASDLPALIENQFSSEVEQTALKKLGMVDRIIEDRVRYLNAKEYRTFLDVIDRDATPSQE